MTRSKLIARLSQQFAGRYSEAEVHKLVLELIEQIGANVTSGRRVELRGFGALSLRRLGSKRGRNPRTNQSLALEARNSIYFRASKQMRESVKDVIPKNDDSKKK